MGTRIKVITVVDMAVVDPRDMIEEELLLLLLPPLKETMDRN